MNKAMVAIYNTPINDLLDLTPRQMAGARNVRDYLIEAASKKVKGQGIEYTVEKEATGYTVYRTTPLTPGTAVRIRNVDMQGLTGRMYHPHTNHTGREGLVVGYWVDSNGHPEGEAVHIYRVALVQPWNGGSDGCLNNIEPQVFDFADYELQWIDKLTQRLPAPNGHVGVEEDYEDA